MFLLNKSSVISAVVIIILIHFTEGINKYSEKANKPKPKTDFSYPINIRELRQIDKPFRMHKLNVVWTKAKHVSFLKYLFINLFYCGFFLIFQRLTDPKLQSLFSDLKLHDKEEISFKHLKADGKDDYGLEEARLRKKFRGNFDF